MATKLGKMVAYYEGLPLIKLLDPSVMWIYEVIYYILYIST